MPGQIAVTVPLLSLPRACRSRIRSRSWLTEDQRHKTLVMGKPGRALPVPA